MGDLMNIIFPALSSIARWSNEVICQSYGKRTYPKCISIPGKMHFPDKLPLWVLIAVIPGNRSISMPPTGFHSRRSAEAIKSWKCAHNVNLKRDMFNVRFLLLKTFFLTCSITQARLASLCLSVLFKMSSTGQQSLRHKELQNSLTVNTEW